MADAHPLLDVFLRAAQGQFPAPDGSVEVVAPSPGLPAAIVAFTAHHFVAAAVDAEWVRTRVAADPIGIPLTSAFMQEVAARVGTSTGGIDAVLASRPHQTGAMDLITQDETFEHPRVKLAGSFRRDLRVYTTVDGSGTLVLARGLAGRLEVSFEVESSSRHAGLGRRLLEAGLRLAGAEPVFAQVAPGNAASLRAVLAAGFRPIGAEAWFRPASSRPG
jgi:GNAT superfamily N-acetyltransferase